MTSPDQAAGRAHAQGRPTPIPPAEHQPTSPVDKWAALRSTTSTTNGTIKNPAVTFEKHFPKDYQPVHWNHFDSQGLMVNLLFGALNGGLLIMNIASGHGLAALISLVGVTLCANSYRMKRNKKRGQDLYALHHDKEDPDFVHLDKTEGTHQTIKVIVEAYNTLQSTATPDFLHHLGPWEGVSGEMLLWDTWEDIRLIAASEDPTFPANASDLVEEAKRRVLDLQEDLQARTRAIHTEVEAQKNIVIQQGHQRILAEAEVRRSRIVNTWICDS